ncbi:ubiquinol oxidase subunit II [Buchnera aphidicola]|uniref:ubiquinol oxidase subunit II n=1 Tax=Buchnera aphidicola TaxID=9 RepID=UPI003464618A
MISSTFLLLTGCNSVILHPSGMIGAKIKNLILTSFITMLIVVIPAIFLSIFFFLKYNEKNTNIKYNPNWSHSNKLELVIWTIPFLIILFLGLVSWNSTHQLDPNKTIISKNQPIVIDVISVDWRWLFIYKKERIASINEIAIPINTPIIFHITSGSVMNSFFIPALGSQIYAMAGMKSSLNLIANTPGKYQGISSNYSGSGFSDMKFNVLVVENNTAYNEWIKKVQSDKNTICNYEEYLNIAKPNHSKKVIYFSCVCFDLFNYVIKNMHKK